MLNIVIVEDHDLLREEIVNNLKRADWCVRGVYNGVALDAVLHQQAADIVVLDLNLPGEDGLSIAKRLREGSQALGIIIMTARKNPNDRTIGYGLGVDVFINKPTQVGELESVISNLSARISTVKSASVVPEQARQPYTLHVTRMQLLQTGGGSLNLSPAEAHLLHLLYTAPRQQLAIADLLAGLADRGVNSTQNTLVTKISRLCQKIQTHFSAEDLLVSIYGYGYKIAATVQLVE